MNTDSPGIASRRAAMQALHAVTALGRPLDMAWPRAAAGLHGPDRALAHALAGQALRWLLDLDRLIDGATARPLPADARARQALRVALAGALLLRTPPHAVIATTLPLLDGGPRKLAHAVLSRLLREGTGLPPRPTLPPAWVAALGPLAEAAADALGETPPTDLTLRDPAATAEWAARLGGESLFPGHVRLAGSRQITALPGYAEGDWWVQDAAAQLPARLLGDVRGLAVLDLCAAPGGKTLQLAAAGARVTALDGSAARMARLRENLARTKLSAELVVADALGWEPARAFDAVLLDAPCSASGVFRRHPDVLHLKALDDIGRLADVQRRLLARAAAWVKPGGRLVYAVCSVLAEEGEAVAAGCPLAAEAVRAEELPAGLGVDAAGRVRTGPADWADKGRADGFFVARFGGA